MDENDRLWAEAMALMEAHGGEYPCECGELGKRLPGLCEYADRCEQREPVQCWRLAAEMKMDGGDKDAAD